jgi:hypothetical protein
VSNRLLVETGFAIYSTGIKTMPPKDPTILPEVGGGYKTVAALEQNTNICFRASACVGGYNRPQNVSYSTRSSASYVTGSHNFKFGLQTLYGYSAASTKDYDYSVRLRNAIPNQITQRIVPDDRRSDALEVGLFVQDQWTVKRVTLNYGLRFDHQTGWVPEQELGGGAYVGPRSFPRIDNLPNYKDLSPRFGVAYDVFGTGKTAIKGTFNRYVDLGGNGVSSANNPVSLSVLSATRTWTDQNGNYVPDCDLRNPLAQDNRASGGDLCQQLSDLNFGNLNPRNLGYHPDILTGWGVRQYNWETSLQFEHEVFPGVSAEVGYFRRWYGNLITSDNLLVGPSDYGTYCVTAPLDSRLPGGGGYQVCDLTDVNPNKFGQVQTQTLKSADNGDRTDNWRGVDATINMRLPGGATVNGGLSTGRFHRVDCAIVDAPVRQYCDTLQPWQHQLKFLGRWPTPWYGIELSGVYQNLPGQAIRASVVYTSAQILPSLGRNLSAGAAGNVTIDLIQPDTQYFQRATQVDLRVAKSFRLNKYRITTGMDLNNLLNGHELQKYPTVLTADWPRPTEIQPARYVGFNATVTF